MAASLTLPQWSPVFATGVTVDRTVDHTARCPRRNGARSSRPGSPAASGGGTALPTCSPQWSPVFATGVTWGVSASGLVGGHAAMEPGLRDRGHCPSPSRRRAGSVPAAMEPGLRDRGHLATRESKSLTASSPQWSPVFATGVTPVRHDQRPGGERRNGARSSRPGSPHRSGTPCSPARRRNGARSSRPGSRAGARPAQPRRSRAAMEPGLRDRGHPPRPRPAPLVTRPAAMEPGLRDRGHPGGGLLMSGHSSRAAMEPGLRDRGHL